MGRLQERKGGKLRGGMRQENKEKKILRREEEHKRDQISRKEEM